MKIKINSNIFWTTIFVNRLSSLGLKKVCISPGSRSTPLTLAFAGNKKIRSFVHIDERSSGFFALGLAKATGKPTAVVCTSGTAAVELYPSIVEAYQQRVPLIICTADRPPEQRGKGANQTINQENLYKNHIRFYTDAGLPDVSAEGAGHISSITEKAYLTSIVESGPVHINFPFRKPFEPESFTDEIDDSFLSLPLLNKQGIPLYKMPEWFFDMIDILDESKKILLIAGPSSYDPLFNKYCNWLSDLKGLPVFADVYSHLRSGREKKKNIITVYDAMLRNRSLREKIEPDLIIQFGRAPTSKVLLNYLADSPARKIMINTYGDWFDPSNTAEASYAMDPALFCKELLNHWRDGNSDAVWLRSLIDFEKAISSSREYILLSAGITIEPRVIREVIDNVPSGTNLMVSNSSPIRDIDYFTPLLNKKINFFFNRGASGIDGIVSTALGITAGLRKSSILITGDLALLYDINALLAGSQLQLPLTIILLNNNGGGIFNTLPVSDHKKIFNKYFITPHNMEFGHLVKSFGWNYKLIKTAADLKLKLNESLAAGAPSVLEIRTDAKESLALKKKYWSTGYS